MPPAPPLSSRSQRFPAQHPAGTLLSLRFWSASLVLLDSSGPEEVVPLPAAPLTASCWGVGVAAWIARRFRQRCLGLKSPNLELTERPDDVTV